MRFLVAVLISVCVVSPASAAVTLDAPTSVAAGAPFEVRFSGSENGRDFITIVAPDLPEGKYSAYKYARDKGVVQMVAPDEAGTYELRYLAANSPYPTLARSPLEVTPVTATVKTAESSAAGSPPIVDILYGLEVGYIRFGEDSGNNGPGSGGQGSGHGASSCRLERA